MAGAPFTLLGQYRCGSGRPKLAQAIAYRRHMQREYFSTPSGNPYKILSSTLI